MNETIREKKLILDTSAILSRRVSLMGGNVATTPSVLDEIKLGKIARYTGFSSDIMEILIPGKDSLVAARDAAEATGDLRELSSTDLDVIALSLDLDGILVTDDYAMQNVASRLGLEFIGADLRTIDRDIRWQYRCTGCGKIFQQHVDICPVCGHQTKRAVRSYKKRQ
ncbi:MAG: PIN domain-containing protein [Thermoplasmataceae archaeon]